jgi:hypothetical protein
MVRACRDAGVRIGLWPMLAHADGRWPNVHNAELFQPFAERLLAACAAEPPDELAIDLEPPIHEFRALVALEGAIVTHMLRRRGVRRGAARFAELLAHLEERGVASVAAVVPLVLADMDGGGWQRFFGTPISLPFSRVSPMLYTSLFEGYSRGVIGRREAVELLDAGARAAVRRFGTRASASLGAVGSGVLGDEPIYRSVDELREDVAVAHLAGIEDIMIYSLDGMLARPPVEAWLDTLVDTSAATTPSRSPRSTAILATIVAATRAMSAGRAVARAWASLVR